MSFLKNLGFQPLNIDANIFIYHGKEENDVIIISLYVDNSLLVSKFNSLIKSIKQYFKGKYNVKDLRKIKTIISWQVIQNIKASTPKIDQSALIQNLLKEENLSNCNSVNISMKADNLIKINNVNNYEKTNIKTY